MQVHCIFLEQEYRCIHLHVYMELPMTTPLSEQTIAIVKSTAPILQVHGVEITTRMYERLFVDPEIKALFDTHIKPEHYPAVANALLPAIKDVLGDAVDDTVLNAWGEAYWFLADVLKARETMLYTEAA